LIGQSSSKEGIAFDEKIHIKMVRHHRFDLYCSQSVSLDSVRRFEGSDLGFISFRHTERYCETGADFIDPADKHIKPGSFYPDHQCFPSLSGFGNSAGFRDHQLLESILGSFVDQHC
jgi:hypothetical protein